MDEKITNLLESSKKLHNKSLTSTMEEYRGIIDEIILDLFHIPEDTVLEKAYDLSKEHTHGNYCRDDCYLALSDYYEDFTSLEELMARMESESDKHKSLAHKK